MKQLSLTAAALAAALLLAGCGGARRPSGNSDWTVDIPTVDDFDTAETAPPPKPPPRGMPPARPTPTTHSSRPDRRPLGVEPTIQADNIDLPRLERGNGIDLDYNAYYMFPDDGLSIIQQGTSYGLIDYDGNIVVPVEYMDISMGYDSRYAMTKDNVNYDTLNADGSVSSLGETAYVDVLGTAPNRMVYWVAPWNALYLSGGGGCHRRDALRLQRALRRPGGQRHGRVRLPRLHHGHDADRRHQPAERRHLRPGGRLQLRPDPGVPRRPVGIPGRQGQCGHRLYGGGQLDYANRNQVSGQELVYPASYGCVVVTGSDGTDALFAADGTQILPFGSYEDLRPVHGDKLWARQDGKWGVLQLDAPRGDSQTGYATLATGVQVAPDVMTSRSVVSDANDGLVLRAGPGTDYDRLGSVPLAPPCRCWAAPPACRAGSMWTRAAGSARSLCWTGNPAANKPIAKHPAFRVGRRDAFCCLQVFDKEGADGIEHRQDHDTHIGKDGQPHVGNAQRTQHQADQLDADGKDMFW